MTRTGRILVVDDDAAIRTVVGQALKRDGHRVIVVATIAEAEMQLAATAPDVLVTDVVLPDGNGLDLVERVVRAHPGLPVIVLSAQNTLTTAVRSTEVGAFDYLPKPFDLDVLSRTVQSALARGAGAVADPIEAEDRALPLIGRSPAMQDVYRIIARVVSNDLTVLISGESGTGKELVARAIHDLGPRRRSPFLALNMAAIPRELIEAELFGHERGAFTGAQARSAGRFEQAAGGTLFLDEIGDVPLPLQVKLLRFLQERTIERIGGRKAIAVDTRIVCATHQDVDAMVAAGTFREDLYYRLAEIVVRIPALAERSGDAALLAQHFLKLYAASMRSGVTGLAPDARAAIASWPWPGNVRELENRMKRAVIMAEGKLVTAADLDLAEGRDELPLNLRAAREGADRATITQALARAEGNISNTAKLLGVSRPTLYDLLKSYDLHA